MKEYSLLVGGWKEVSLVDVLGHVSFTLWLSGCNLRCPWCSNTSLARGEIGERITIRRLLELVREAVPLVEYFHVTGGEPTLQFKALKMLLESVRDELGLMLSIDTNATIPEALERLVPILDHIAIDVKAPLSDFSKYAAVTGMSVEFAKRILPRIRRGILVASGVPFLELRTTFVPGLVACGEVLEIVEGLEKLLSGTASGRVIYVVQQFIPYEGVRGVYSRLPRTPSEVVKKCAEEVASRTSLFEVYYRTLEEGSRSVSTTPSSSLRHKRL
ncbi:MAG: anaerobic ribonucleoside-triphosphate reductase activating protein [Thermoprotei archaeon]|nr:MAG: anaerobic ribonucleoside-triphosphate reductase activating protein [Thermoprotei archaeon]